MKDHFINLPNADTVAGIFYASWLREPLFRINPKVQFRETFKNGWGLVALDNMERSELIEFARGESLEVRDEAQKDSKMHKILWKNPIGDIPACHCMECKTFGHLFYLFGGNINYYNQARKIEDANVHISIIENAHSNIKWKDDYPPTPCHLAIAWAAKDIKAGEELIVYYGDRYNENFKILRKIPHVETQTTMYPPDVILWNNQHPNNQGFAQPDGTSLIVGNNAGQKKINKQKFKESVNTGEIPEDLDLEKLLQGGLNRVDPNK